MKRESIPARNLESGMVIVPPLRSMRHAVVERMKCSDGDGLSIGVGVPRDMRNHHTSYIVVATDIGTRSFEADQFVDVLVATS